jgi:hypothetical protein
MTCTVSLLSLIITLICILIYVAAIIVLEGVTKIEITGSLSSSLLFLPSSPSLTSPLSSQFAADLPEGGTMEVHVYCHIGHKGVAAKQGIPIAGMLWREGNDREEGKRLLFLFLFCFVFCVFCFGFFLFSFSFFFFLFFESDFYFCIYNCIGCPLKIDIGSLV